MKCEISGFTRLLAVFFALSIVAVSLVSGCRILDIADGDDSNIPAPTSTISGKVVKSSSSVATRRDSRRPTLIAADLAGATGVVGAEVWLERLASDARYRTITDASGTYRFINVPPGNHRVIVKYNDPTTGKTMKTRSATISVAETPGPVEVPDLAGEPALNMVTGQLRDAEGNFLPEGTVMTLWGESFTVGKDGVFTSPALPASAREAEILVQLPGGNSLVSFTAPFVSDVVPAYVELKLGADKSGNHAPSVILNATVNGQAVAKVNPGTIVTLKAVGSDTDSGDQAALAIDWTVTSGTLAAGPSAFEKVWTAPDYFTVATVTVEVKDPKNATGKAKLPILVGVDNPSQIDSSRPTVALTADSEAVADSAAFNVTITFNEPVTGFEIADISVTNGVLADFSTVTARKVFKVKVTPQAAGEVKVSIAENVAADLSNNKNSVSNILTVTNTLTPAKSSLKAITAFSFPALSVNGTINGSNIAVTVPFGTNVGALVANFTASAKTTVKVGDTLQVSGTTANNFSSAVTYKVTAEDGSAAEYTVTVTVAQPTEIAAAAVTITAPVLGATPQSAAAVEAATNNADYTVTGMTWNQALTAGGKFKAGQAYTATVTLTSKNNKMFQAAAFIPTVAGSALVGNTTTTGSNTGNSVSFTVTYATTGALAVTGVSVTTQPTKLNYTEATDGDLALNGMVVTETNNDGSTNTVTFTNGTAAGYTANPSNGTALTNASHNGHPVTITHTASSQTANTSNLTVGAPPAAGTKVTHTANGVNFKVSYVPSATFPTGSDNSGTQTVAKSFWVGETEVTYELWHTVKQWATSNGYTFQNAGMEGSVTGGGAYPNYANVGAAPTGAKNEPVTMVSWRDTVVWCNALSEMLSKEPVYRTVGGDIIRSSADANAAVVDAAVATANNGFRLPTEWEWELAARWKNDSSSTDGSIERGGRFWTPGNYASGATADYNDAAATQLAAWYSANSGAKTQNAGQKPVSGNHLGVHDMSGNVWEWCWDIYSGSHRVFRGGSWYFSAGYVTVAGRNGNYPSLQGNSLGFRVVRP